MIRIAVTADLSKPRTCFPGVVLEKLLKADRLVNFTKAAAEGAALAVDGLGNCHEISTGLLVDLYLAGCAEGWRWATGDTRHFSPNGIREHSWLEVEGWALDFVGALSLLIFTERSWYRRFQHTKNVKLRDAEATKRWLLKRAYLEAKAP